MRAYFTDFGGEHLKEVLGWWSKHRPEAPTLIQEELRLALAQIRAMPDVGAPFRTVRGIAIRRLLLPRSMRLLYYSLDKKAAEILIHAVWGAQRGSEPQL